jgi:hypothetical protein
MPLDRDDPALDEAGERSLGILKRELRAVLGEPGGDVGDRDFGATVALCWSAVHGYARLLIDGQLKAVDPTLGHEELLGDIADRAVELMVRPLVGGPPVARAPRSGQRK